MFKSEFSFSFFVCVIRKKELVKFACRARQLFIRILAVVKWAATARKVHACEVNIHWQKFDWDSFIRTGNSKFSGISCSTHSRNIRYSRSISTWKTSWWKVIFNTRKEHRNTLDFRIPNYPITDAVDALTLGSVNFMPERISVCDEKSSRLNLDVVDVF